VDKLSRRGIKKNKDFFGGAKNAGWRPAHRFLGVQGCQPNGFGMGFGNLDL
jgi:hypothetical protein